VAVGPSETDCECERNRSREVRLRLYGRKTRVMAFIFPLLVGLAYAVVRRVGLLLDALILRVMPEDSVIEDGRIRLERHRRR
jgi:hypothetical protein